VSESKFTIRFSAKVVSSNPAETPKRSIALTLPRDAGSKLRTVAEITTVEGTINGFPFRASLKQNGDADQSLEITNALQEAAGIDCGDTAIIEITRIGEEPEPRQPKELHKALAGSPRAKAAWADITPLARRDWILWITSAKQSETRQTRIEKACSMLASGKRRVCCFGGLNWLTKDHRSVDTWRALPR
jgi:hypothetical protein